jgi:hypothetical protein
VTFCLLLMWRVFRVIANVDLPRLFIIFCFRCGGLFEVHVDVSGFTCRNHDDKNLDKLPFITANGIAQKEVFPKSVRASANAAKFFLLPNRRFWASAPCTFNRPLVFQV